MQSYTHRHTFIFLLLIIIIELVTGIKVNCVVLPKSPFASPWWCCRAWCLIFYRFIFLLVDLLQLSVETLYILYMRKCKVLILMFLENALYIFLFIFTHTYIAKPPILWICNTQSLQRIKLNIIHFITRFMWCKVRGNFLYHFRDAKSRHILLKTYKLHKIKHCNIYFCGINK